MPTSVIAAGQPRSAAHVFSGVEWASAIVVAEAAADGDYEACRDYTLPEVSPAPVTEDTGSAAGCHDAKARFAARQHEYRQLRGGADRAATRAARKAMAQALHTFTWAGLAEKAAEDEREAGKRREARDDAMRFTPEDAVTGPRDPADEVARRAASGHGARTSRGSAPATGKPTLTGRRPQGDTGRGFAAEHVLIVVW